MYKLLLATDKAEVQELFAAMSSWETLGFRAPRIVSSVNGAITSLKSNHADAIVVAFSAQDEALLMDHLTALYPYTPVMVAEKTIGALEDSLKELRMLLNRTHADFSDDSFGEADMMQLCRHEFFRALLDGRVKKQEDVKRYMRLIRSRMDADQPCVVVELSTAAGDNYIKGRWHYGMDRLEVALRNFFGVELEGMRILVSVLPGERIMLLACPMVGAQASDSMTGLVSAHAQECMDHVREYLDLDLHISNIRVLPALTALASETHEKTGRESNGPF